MKKNLLQLIPVILFAAFVPTVFVKAVSDGVCTEVPGLGSVICQINELLGSILPALIAFGVVYFIWGVVRFMIADGEEAKTKGKDQIGEEGVNRAHDSKTNQLEELQPRFAHRASLSIRRYTSILKTWLRTDINLHLSMAIVPIRHRPVAVSLSRKSMNCRLCRRPIATLH